MGESLCREKWGNKLAAFDALFQRRWDNRTVALSSLRGFAAGFAIAGGLFLGLVALRAWGAFAPISYQFGPFWNHARWLGPAAVLFSAIFALYTTLFVTVWFLMGFYMLIFIGGLQDIPRDYYEAAEIDGATRFQKFWNITLPLLRPTSFFVLLISLVAAVAGGQAFDLVYVMTKGGPANSTTVLIFYIYQQAFGYSQFGYAAAMASFVVLILLLATLLLFLLTRGGRFNND